jgi:methylated-DNA-[protein]-cysteine S-methyltransferase
MDGFADPTLSVMRCKSKGEPMRSQETAPLEYLRASTAIGAVLVAGDATAVRFIRFPRQSHPEVGWRRAGRGPVLEAARQLDEYLAHKRRAFDLPIAPEGTPFQQRVWRELERIPYGETLSYGEIARRIGQPTASRAVGAANGANPIPIIIPCHRAVGADGSLTGFGGGLDVKAKLLALEAGQAALATIG